MNDFQRVTIDSEIRNQGAASLAENEEIYLNTIHDTDDHLKQDELASWIGEILGEDLTAESLFDDLNSGVRLLYLAKSIQLIRCNHLKDSNYQKAVENLKPDEYTMKDRLPPKRASQIAKQRSNIAKFLEWCTDIGVPYITLFETEDLIHRKNRRQVTTCLLYVSRLAFRFGVEPPSSIKEELKIEQEKTTLPDDSTGSFVMLHSDSSNSDSNLLADNEMENNSKTSHSDKEYFVDEGNHEELNTPSPVKSLSDLNYSQSPLPMSFDMVIDNDERARTTDKPLSADASTFTTTVEDREIPRITNANEFHFRPVDAPVTHHIPRTQYEEDDWSITVHNKNRLPSDSTSDEMGKYHIRAAAEYPHLWHGSPVVNADGENEDLSDLSESYQPADANSVESIQNSYSSSVHDIKELYVDQPTWPYSLYRVPADILIEQSSSEETSDDSTTEDNSFSSDEKTFIDIAVGSDEPQGKDAFTYVKQQEIMIDFPPYFELIDLPKQYPILPPPQEYVVAPVEDDPVYSIPHKSRSLRPREQHRNPAFQHEIGVGTSVEDYSANHRSLDTYYRREWRYISDSPVFSDTTTNTRVKAVRDQNDIGTQTHVTFTDGVVHIISEMEDYSTLRRNNPGASNGQTSNGTIIIRSQNQRNLPSRDEEVSITQASDRETSETARWGSVGSSVRIRRQDVDTEVTQQPTPLRRGVIRRTSSRISQQLRKAAFAAKKYRKRTIVVAILIVLCLGVLTSMLVVFLSR